MRTYGRQRSGEGPQNRSILAGAAHPVPSRFLSVFALDLRQPPRQLGGGTGSETCVCRGPELDQDSTVLHVAILVRTEGPQLDQDHIYVVILVRNGGPAGRWGARTDPALPALRTLTGVRPARVVFLRRVSGPPFLLPWPTGCS